MNLGKVKTELDAIHKELSEYERNARRIEARRQMVERLGGEEAVRRLHEMAIDSMYAEGRTLD